ncbi:protein of unknown function (plasmid) [Citrobacter freundii]|nr:protein of unknown function [Citrobacter freundii]
MSFLSGTSVFGAPRVTRAEEGLALPGPVTAQKLCQRNVTN